ncbi:MAG: nuclear transport factor 2 family protein [Acidimicrobiales bacterium]
MADPAPIDFADWHAIFDLSVQYAQHIDTRNWDAFVECFAPRVHVDFSSFTRHPAPTEPIAITDWLAAVRSTIDGFAATQHLIGNQRIVLESPTEARYSAYVQAQHWMDPQRWYLVGGWYDNRVTRIDGAWRISTLKLNQLWDNGDRGLLREVNRRTT